MEGQTGGGFPANEAGGSPSDIAHEKAIRFRLSMVAFTLFLVFVIGLFWLALSPSMAPGLTLAFLAGLSMIFLPCTLPLAFVIVPMTLGKNPMKGFIMAILFGLGLMITLSLYGVFIAYLGQKFGLKADAEVYAVLIGGFVAFLFGLSEIGLIRFKPPSYAGKFPDFIQRQKDYVKVFLLGLLLGNAGVGCPNPAFYVLLGYIATVGDIFNGWFLGFVHGLGRAIPLIFLAILGTLGINALSGLSKHKDAVERVMGWTLVFIGAYLFTFGLFGHDWFVSGGMHTAWERFIVSILGDRFGENILQHDHEIITKGLIKYGNLFFLGLIALSIGWYKIKFKKTIRDMRRVLIAFGVVVLIIGYTTGWTFTLSKYIHGGGHGAAETTVEEDHNGKATDGDHMLSGASDIAKLRKRGPSDRVDELPYIMKNGVKEFHLTVDEIQWEYEPGKYIHAWAYNGQVPGPTIRVPEGEKIRITVKNNLTNDATSVHWHGQSVSWEADGVPGLTQDPIRPGETFVYEFTTGPSGTRWYHSHGSDHTTSAQQIDMGLSGVFIVEPKTPTVQYDREYVLLLDEWDVLPGGVNSAIGHIHGASKEAATPTYNMFTINGNVLPYIDPIKVKEGEDVLIRIVNAGTAEFHPMHTHGHEFKLVALDGNPVPPAAIQDRNTYTLHPGETADFLLTANNPGNWLFHCHQVHHAAAGMVMLVEYEGFNGPTTDDLRRMAGAVAEETGDHEHGAGTPSDHEHGMMMGEAGDGHTDHTDEAAVSSHEHEAGTPSDHEHGMMTGDMMEEMDEHMADTDTHMASDGHTDHEHAPVSRGPWYESGRWWSLFIGSLILMVLLSLFVRNYLQGKRGRDIQA